MGFNRMYQISWRLKTGKLIEQNGGFSKPCLISSQGFSNGWAAAIPILHWVCPSRRKSETVKLLCANVYHWKPWSSPFSDNSICLGFANIIPTYPNTIQHHPTSSQHHQTSSSIIPTSSQHHPNITPTSSQHHPASSQHHPNITQHHHTSSNIIATSSNITRHHLT